MYFKLIFIRLFILLSGALFGYGILPSFWGISGSVLGMMAAMIAWTVIDIHRQQSIIHWIRSEDHSLPARASGHWADLADKLWRLWRQFDKQKTENDERLKQFLSAIQASPNGVVLLDQNNRIEWCNQTCAHHFDFDVIRDVDQNITNLLRDPVFIAYFQSGKYDTDIVINAPKSTSSHPVRISVHLHEYDRGRKLLLSRDITLLEQAESMRRDFVANVSHEIRTPLTVLGGFVDTLIHLPLEEAERLHYLKLMAEQARRMQSLVEDLLTLSKLEANPSPHANEWVDVASLLTQVHSEAEHLSQIMYPQGHQLNFEVMPHYLMNGAATELMSAMANLVNNAIRYTPEGGSITVSWTVHADHTAEFAVTDTGPGIAPEHIPRLTERFYRVDSSRSRETGGTGLGLAIVKHVAQRHGARLQITSKVGLGSRFALIFPAEKLRFVQDTFNQD